MNIVIESHIQKSIEYFRGITYLSLYGILNRINSDDKGDLEFYHHSQKVLKYFNDFDDREDDEEFMKCLLGLYEIKENSKEYPTYIKEYVRQRRGLEKWDVSEDHTILEMSKSAVLKDVCNWNGLLGYDETIKRWIYSIYGIDLDNVE